MQQRRWKGLTIKEMQERKKELGYTNEMLAEKSGVPLGTVQKIFAGFTKAPRRKTIEALESVLTDCTADERSGYQRRAYFDEGPLSTGMVREDTAVYGMKHGQGQYTLEDYYALPDERRVELIDGYFYDMASPTSIHQTILGELHILLAQCVSKHPECRLFFAPMDVRLDNDDYTILQPDVFIICNSEDRDIRRINGVPDFIIEVLSPSTRYHDMFRKLNKYKSAGVREYWIVDPDRKSIAVYCFEYDILPVSYTFDDTVPVFISKGECSVDFATINDKLKWYEH